jgi:hypothetical protein
MSLKNAAKIKRSAESKLARLEEKKAAYLDSIERQKDDLVADLRSLSERIGRNGVKRFLENVIL